MKVLVTGGAGYIGSVVVAQLVAEGHSVVVFDNLSQGHRAAVHPKATFVKGDLAKRSNIDRAIESHRPDAVMHFASRTLVGESMTSPFLYLGHNTRCGLNLLESMAEHGVLRLVFSSTANLFGKPTKIPITEEEDIVPGSPYGESKNIIERMLKWLDQTCGLQSIALRYFNAAGATDGLGEDHDPETHLIPIVLQTALGLRDELTIFGGDYATPDGTCVRDYVHVADLAQAHLLALKNLQPGSVRYNLGNEVGYSVRDVVEVARKVTGHPIPTRLVARRGGDPAILIASSEKICRELGWNRRYPSLREILETAWRWHKRHPHGYADFGQRSMRNTPRRPKRPRSRRTS